MKRMIVLFILGVLVVSCMIACGRKEESGQTEENATAPAVVLPELPKVQVSSIEAVFGIDLPDEGEVLYYENSLKDDQLGSVYAEITLSEADYENVLGQIKDAYMLETLKTAYLEADKFTTTSEEIDVKFVRFGGIREKTNYEKIEKIPLTVYYNIYLTKVENGVFRIMFSVNNC